MPLSASQMDQIRHAYQEGVKRGRQLAAPHLDEQLEGALGFSVAHVDKYSPDQSAWAARRFAEERAWRRGRRVDVTQMIRRLRTGPPALSGCDFRRYFPGGPEMGEATAAGNIFVAAGLTNLVSLWMGLSATGAVHPLTESAGTSVCGVGTGTATAAVADVSLTSTGGSAWFQAFDASSLGTTSTAGVVVGTCTYGTANANFAWNEWCWATGSGAVTAGSYGSTTAGSPFATANSWAMVNHKAPVSLGTKASGSSWVFSTTFTIS